jgi:hypothetical protein
VFRPRCQRAFIGPFERRTAIFTLCASAALWIGACSNPPASPTPRAATCTPAPGVVCFGQNGYVEYAAGDFPIVVSVPHGGAMTPAAIPDRTSGTTVTDTNTIELGRAIAQAFLTRTGRPIHLVLCHLRRTKLDANREVGEAAQGNGEAIQAWTEYHAFVDQAARDVLTRSGRGLYVDLHGHGHPKARLELGYLLTGPVLDRSNAELDSQGVAAQSSLRLAMMLTASSFSEMLRGPTSLGGRLAPVPSVPSPVDPSPGADPFFEGGYSTARHTATLPGLQIESHFGGIRDTAASRAAFAATLVEAVLAFMRDHLGL